MSVWSSSRRSPLSWSPPCGPKRRPAPPSASPTAPPTRPGRSRPPPCPTRWPRRSRRPSRRPRRPWPWPMGAAPTTDGGLPRRLPGEGEARAARSSTCPAACSTTGPPPTAATPRPRPPRPTASAPPCAETSAAGCARPRSGRRPASWSLDRCRRGPRSWTAAPSTIRAATPSGDWPTSMSAMLTPASPRTVPTRPMTPGLSSLRTTSMWSAGGTSTAWSSTITIRGLACSPASVPAKAWPAAAQGDQVHVVLGRCWSWPRDRQALLLGHRRGVDVGHRLVGQAAEEALLHRQGEDPGVVVGQLALVLDPELVGQLGQEGGEQPAQPLGQGQERPHGLGGLGRRHVHGEGHEVAGEGQAHLLGDGLARLVLGLGGAGPEVGGDDHAGQRRTAASSVVGSSAKTSMAAPPTWPSTDGVGQGLLVDDAAPGHVDDAHAGLDLLQRPRRRSARRCRGSWPRAGSRSRPGPAARRAP